MTRRLAACAAVAVVAFAGCGDDDKDSNDKGAGGGTATTSVEGLPKPNAPLATRIAAAETAFKTGECAKIVPFFHTRERPDRNAKAGTPPSAKECKAIATQLASFKSLDFRKSQESGTVAVVDGHDGKKAFSSLWVLEDNGDWGFDPTSQLTPDAKDPDVHQVGTKPRPGNKYDANAETWIKAVQEKDCDTVWRLLSFASSIVYLNQNKQAMFCKAFAGAFAQPKSFYARAAATKDLKLEKVGATDHNAFYALKMKDGSIYTIVVTENLTSGFTPQERTGHDPDGIFNYYRNKDAAPA